jgi:MscS family membrane protein
VGACCLFGILAIGHTRLARADDIPPPGITDDPLQPVDTSSPRAALQGYLDAMNRCYELGYLKVQRYLESPRLFPTSEEMASIKVSQHRLLAAERALDLSGLPPATLPQSARRVTIQLKEILDRIEIPPFETVPDAQAMAGAEFKRWTLPRTEIRITRIDVGPRAGEYLFSADTVSRLPEFYDKIRRLPYNPGASEGLYGLVVYSPAGIAMIFDDVIPARWLLDLPSWALTPVFDQPLWRWVGILLVLGAGFLVVRYFHRLRHRWKRRESAAARWARLLRPLSIVIVAPIAALILDDLLRVSGIVGKTLTLSMWTLYSLALTWLVWVVGAALAESVIASERLRASSIDSQLIRLAVRLLTIVLAFAILIEGGNRIGLPAYSVVAGLGVGGLAVALAGQQTLANLLGSVIIMVEKPFRIGDCIKVGGMEGTVEDVGFRSTRIRTPYDSLVTIPSSQLVTSTIDNLDRRHHREVKTLLNLTYDAPPDRIEAFVNGIRSLLQAHPGIRKDNIQVAFHDFGPHSLDIHLKFFVRASDRLAELAERERIFLDILRLADQQGVQFAFPTQTLHVETIPEGRAPSA